MRKKQTPLINNLDLFVANVVRGIAAREIPLTRTTEVKVAHEKRDDGSIIVHISFYDYRAIYHPEHEANIVLGAEHR